MSRSSWIRWSAALIVVLSCPAVPVDAQSSEPDPFSAGTERPARLNVADVSLEMAMDALVVASGVAIVYSPSIFPGDRSVTCSCESVPVREAVERLLAGTDLELVSIGGQLVIRRIPGSSGASSELRQGSLQGIVIDETTGQPLIGATVVLEVDGEIRHGTQADRSGFYQIGSIVPGLYTLRITYLGYIPHEVVVVLASEERRSISVGLMQDPVLLEEILVDAPGGGVARRDLGRQQVRPVDLRRVPQPAASGDMVSYLQTLPGVVAHGDRGGQLFVRGGTPAENMALIDGALIYQPFHIVGFFSAFPEGLVADADFYPGGFGARYSGRTSSVLDVQMRDGNRSRYEASGSASPFVAEATVEGPIRTGQASWIASVRRSLIEDTGRTFTGARQPLYFESQFLKLTSFEEDGSRCSVMGMRTADAGRMDVDDPVSRVSWENLVVGGRCNILAERRLARHFEVNFSFSRVTNAAITRQASEFQSKLWRMNHEAHSTNLIGSVPIFVGYHSYVEIPTYDFAELFGSLDPQWNSIWGLGGYFEADLTTFGDRFTLRPGLVVTGLPRAGVEPRVRSRWRPFGRSTEEITAAVGLYRQDLVGVSDTRDVASVFVAWMRGRDNKPMESLHATLGWQQVLPGGVEWAFEGYYKRMRAIPIAEWRSVALFNTELARAEGNVFGIDARLEYDRGPFYGYLGYGYGWTRYQTAQDHFEIWFGDPVQRFHPAHDRRHSANVLVSLELGGFTAGARWQVGSGLPFTQLLGIDEAFDVRFNLEDVREKRGTTRAVLDQPFRGRLPAMHRLDLSLVRSFDLRIGTFDAQVGAINSYDRRHIFYFDAFTGRRVDQLPLVPYLSLMLKPL